MNLYAKEITMMRDEVSGGRINCNSGSTINTRPTSMWGTPIYKQTKFSYKTTSLRNWRLTLHRVSSHPEKQDIRGAK